MAFAEVADEDRFGVEMIDWDIEESLDLRGVEVHGEDAVDAGGLCGLGGRSRKMGSLR